MTFDQRFGGEDFRSRGKVNRLAKIPREKVLHFSYENRQTAKNNNMVISSTLTHFNNSPGKLVKNSSHNQSINLS
jgi:hypothetical protein